MNILGIGIDTVEISRMEDAKKNTQFMQNTFTDTELAYCENFADAASHFAGTFAAKEAVRKATGELARSFSEVEVVREQDGKPVIWIMGAKRHDLYLSITHTGAYASAVVIYTGT